jgi:ATP-dependent DNA helicase RecQ
MDRCGTSCDSCAGSDVLAATPRAPRGRSARARAASGAGTAIAAAPMAARSELDPLIDDRFQRLRKLRKSIADARSVPAYVVFSDTTLLEMAERMPRTAQDLLGISGVGPKKLEQYGAPFLAELAARR